MTTKRQQPETKYVIKPILNNLAQYKLQGDVIWYCRLEAESAPGIPAGTPDIVTIINRKNGTIGTLFIECKRPGKNRLRYEQKKFFESMEGKPLILCVIINDPVQLWPAIKRVGNL